MRRLAAEQQQLNIQNSKIIRDKNTNDYLDQVAQVTSAADLADPAVQQQLMQMRAGFGQMIDRNATRDAIDQRVLQLQKQEVAANQFADQAQEREQRPLLEQLTEAGRTGDRARVNQILKDNSFINEAEVARGADQALDAVTNRQYAAAGQARADRAEQRAIRGEARADAQFNLSQQIQKANLADRQEARQLRRDTGLLQAAELDLKANEAALRAANPLANTSTDVLKDANALVGKVADQIEPWFADNAVARNELTNKFQGLMSDGIDMGGDIGKVKIPPALIEQYLNQAKDMSFRSTGSLLANADDWFKTYATSNPGLFRRAGEVGEQIKQLREALREVNAGKIELLRGNKLDSVGLSDKLNTIRTGIPTNSRPVPGYELLPGPEKDRR
ncbi:MAG: hypothetical protein DI616_15990 [Paracoccus denitrificans]|uniref:Uncharacterized protein n=1 Tax=Paracoccus denitrificans TaxID=266 RepID=A0A533I692_PARDE|nr:MAG: hypothetical protein DI616_15990 [Paracoccus denitrificans]